MIKTFGEGDIYDYADSGGEIDYPVMWVVMQPSQYISGTMRYRLLILFADLLTEDKSNALQVQSDELQVALDILAKLKLDSDYIFNTTEYIPIDFFEERFNDWTAGVTMSLEIIDPSPLNYCQNPL